MADRGIGGVDARDLVAETMDELAPAIEETSTDQDQLPLGEEFAAEEGHQEEGAEFAETQPGLETQPEPEPEVDEAFLRLAEAGVDLGVRKSDLPQELHGAYERLANEALVAVSSMEQRAQQMEMERAEMRQFADKLQKDPQKVLLTMAITKPEEFQAAVSAFEEMQHDERYKNMVVRELQAEAKLSAAERQQSVWQQRQIEQKIKVVTSATHRAADKLGVERELAERMVAVQIQANGGDIDPRQVESVISNLRPSASVRSNPAQKLQRAQQAPNKSVEGQGAPTGRSAVEDQASQGRTRASRSPFLDLIRDSSRRARRE